MERGIVKVTDLNGKGNKIFHSGDEVTPGNFPVGNWEPLIKGGFITEIKPTETVEVKKFVEVKEINNEPTDEPIESNDEPIDLLTDDHKKRKRNK